MASPTISVVMACRDAWDWTQRSLAALETHTTVPHEIIVVDNASADDMAGRIAALFPDVHLIRNTSNLGFGAASNQGAAAARGEVLAFVNSDAVVGADWAGPLLAALELPGVGAVVPAFTNEDGTMQNAGTVVCPDGSVLSLGDGDSVDDPAWQFRRAIDFGAAACMLVRREDFLAAGGFDPVYSPAYFEDVDLCLTLLERGLRTVYVPEVRVLHGCFASGGFDAAADLFRRNQPTFVERWGPSLEPTHPASVWPPDPATTLAARDALATGRAVFVVDELPRSGDVHGAVLRATAEAPWARITLVARTGDPAPWWAQGVEVLLLDEPGSVFEARAGHYDVAYMTDDPGRDPGCPVFADPSAAADTLITIASAQPRFGR